VATALNYAHMKECIAGTVGQLDEAEAFVRVVPLDNTSNGRAGGAVELWTAARSFFSSQSSSSMPGGWEKNRCARLFSRHLSASPSQVARTARVQRAKRLLDETNSSRLVG
jgi:hypothetical protein